MNTKQLSLKDLSELEQHGQRIYKSNPFVRDIATFLENPENQQFYDKYMTDQNELEQTLLFLSVYNSICKHAPHLNGLQKISLLNQFIRDQIGRAHV